MLGMQGSTSKLLLCIALVTLVSLAHADGGEAQMEDVHTASTTEVKDPEAMRRLAKEEAAKLVAEMQARRRMEKEEKSKLEELKNQEMEAKRQQEAMNQAEIEDTKKKQAQEEERKRKQAEEEERKRKQAEEEERKRKQAEEEERKRKQAEEEERKRKQAEEEETLERMSKLEERKRKQEEESKRQEDDRLSLLQQRKEGEIAEEQQNVVKEDSRSREDGTKKAEEAPSTAAAELNNFLASIGIPKDKRIEVLELGVESLQDLRFLDDASLQSLKFPQHQIDALRVKRDVLGPLVASGRKKQEEQESRRDDSTDEEQEKEGAEKMPVAKEAGKNPSVAFPSFSGIISRPRIAFIKDLSSKLLSTVSSMIHKLTSFWKTMKKQEL